MSFSSVTVVGTGAWGTAVAHLLAQNCSQVYLWGSQRAVVDDIVRTGRNDAYLPGIRLHSNVIPTNDIDRHVVASPLFVWAIPVQFLRPRLRAFTKHLPADVICVNLGKGIEENTLARPSAILMQECETAAAVGSLVGPNIALEVGSGCYTEATLGLSDASVLEKCAAAFTTSAFRVHTTIDVDGIEVGAALKNVCAIAAGLCDGLRLGSNTKSLVIAACLEEIRRLGIELAAEPCTFISRCTIGDVLTSCYSESGRNRRLGEYLGSGKSLAESVDLLQGRIAEGVATCRACHALQGEFGRRLPVVDNLQRLFEEQIAPMTCVQNILAGRVNEASKPNVRQHAGAH